MLDFNRIPTRVQSRDKPLQLICRQSGAMHPAKQLLGGSQEDCKEVPLGLLMGFADADGFTDLFTQPIVMTADQAKLLLMIM